MHYLRHMVRGDGAPVRNAGSAMLVPAGIAAVRIALRVPDENGDVRVVHIFVQDHMVAVRRKAQIDQMLVILAA